MPIKNRCKQITGGRGLDGKQWGPCCCSAWKDGYCYQHHPETIIKKEINRRQKWAEECKVSPAFQMVSAKKRIAELEHENANLAASVLQKEKT